MMGVTLPDLVVSPRQRGFALPLALVAIASLAIITLAGYRAIGGATIIATTIQDSMDVERAFFAAEAETAFTFLTGSVAEGGIVTNTTLVNVNDDAVDQTDTSILASNEYWRADGGRRISGTGRSSVDVTYFDATGFAPINSMSEPDLAKLLTAAGFNPTNADEMAARIADFQDEDVQRRVRGAERAEYRLFGASPPTNSPLRKPGELTAVLGYADAAPASSWDFILENARFGGINGTFKPRLGPDRVTGLFPFGGREALATDSLDSYISDDTQPTDTARFLLSHKGEAGLTRRRAVEIIRTANAPDRPFRRVWVYDKVNDDDGPPTAASEQRDMAPVYQPASGADSR